jgi:hypothetical protein
VSGVSRVLYCSASHANLFSSSAFVVRPPLLTSSPPQPSSVTDVPPQDTWDPSAASTLQHTTSTLQHTKHIAHALTQKTYVANQNKICPKAALEGTSDGSIPSTPAPYCDDHATHPMMDSLLDLPNSTLS